MGGLPEGVRSLGGVGKWGGGKPGRGVSLGYANQPPSLKCKKCVGGGYWHQIRKQERGEVAVGWVFRSGGTPLKGGGGLWGFPSHASPPLPRETDTTKGVIPKMCFILIITQKALKQGRSEYQRYYCTAPPPKIRAVLPSFGARPS